MIAARSGHQVAKMARTIAYLPQLLPCDAATVQKMNSNSFGVFKHSKGYGSLSDALGFPGRIRFGLPKGCGGKVAPRFQFCLPNGFC